MDVSGQREECDFRHVSYRYSLPEITLYYFSSRPAGEWYNVLESDHFDTIHVLLVQQVITDANNIEVVSLMSN